MLLLLCAVTITAQKLTVESFVLAEKDLTASTNPRLDNNSEPCALIKVYLAAEGATFEGNKVGSVDFKVNQYWVYLTSGSKQLIVNHPNYLPLEVNFDYYNIKKVEGKRTYVLTILLPNNPTPNTPVQNVVEVKPENSLVLKPDNKPVVKPDKVGANTKSRDFSAYVGLQFQPLSFMGIGGMAGAYFKGINVELEYTAGLSKSDKVYWNSKSTEATSSYSYEYTPSYFGLSLGYAVVNGKSFRLTPQVGIGSVMLKGKEATKGTGTNPNATSGYALSAHVGARADIRFGKSFGVFLTPQFGFAVSQSDLFKRVADVSSGVKGYATGFSAKVGAYYEF